MSINFRFSSGTSQLDNLALRDLDRVVNYLKDKLDHQIFLVGFGDYAGGYEQNISLAMSRAGTVHEQLRSCGITVRELLSCGEELPVAHQHYRYRPPEKSTRGSPDPLDIGCKTITP